MKNPMYAALAVMIASAIGISGVYALGTEYSIISSDNAKTALASNDYVGFVKAAQDNLASSITQERFAAMAKNYQSREAISKAIDDGNYQEWAAAVEAASPPKITDVITQANFATYVQMQKALQSGDMATAKELAQQLGLDKLMPGFGMHFAGHRFGMHQ